MAWPVSNFNTLRPRQNGWHFKDDTFRCILLNENVIISIKNSLKFVPTGPFNNNSALVQIMAWRWPGDKPLFEPMMVRSPMHICVTRHQWVNNGHSSGVEEGKLHMLECKISIRYLGYLIKQMTVYICTFQIKEIFLFLKIIQHSKGKIKNRYVTVEWVAHILQWHNSK